MNTVRNHSSVPEIDLFLRVSGIENFPACELAVRDGIVVTAKMDAYMQEAALQASIALTAKPKKKDEEEKPKSKIEKLEKKREEAIRDGSLPFYVMTETEQEQLNKKVVH